MLDCAAMSEPSTTTPPPSPRPAALRRALPLLAVWMALPALLRLPMLLDWVLREPPDGGGAGSVALGIALGLVQDAFVAFQALVAMVLVRRLTGPQRSLWIWSGCAAFIFFASYTLIDYLLYLGIDLRMTSSFFHFFLDAGVFMDSVDEIGVRWVAAGIALVVLGSIGLFWRLRARLRPVELTLPLAAGGLLLGVVGTSGALLAPGELMYLANNAVLADQLDTARAWLGIEDALIRHATELDGQRPAIPHPRNEVSHHLDPDRFPLLRTTTGFTGEPLFDLRLEPGERPHVVILVMESFRGLDVGALGGPHGVTPNFDRLARDGILFSSFYAAGVQTTRAVVALLFGIMPRFTPDSVQSSSPHLPLVGLADILRAQGYHAAYLHNGELDFESMEDFFAAHRFQTIVGQRDIEAAFPAAARFSWGVHDEYLMRYALDWLEERDRDGQPSFLTMFTISNHHPWELPPHWNPPPLDVPADTTHGRFLRAMHYSDAALGEFVDGLRERGLAEKTLLFVVADTSQAMGDRNRSFAVSRNLYQENVSIPLLILADGRLDAPRVIDLPGSQVDLLPTIVDLLGIVATHHSIGSSLRRHDPDRIAFFQSPFALGYYGLRHDRWKYFYVLRADRHHLYDLNDDPRELHDLSGRHPELVERYFTDLARIHRLMDFLYDHEAFADAKARD